MMSLAARVLSLALASSSAVAVFAQSAAPALPVPVLPPPHAWQAAVPRLTPEAYFTNLPADARIETPFLVKFGLSGGWGLAPIAKPIGGKSGHHHLLVNRDLPLNFKEALPFNDQYIHFGKGQMETVLTLPPGNYTLRLLLADDKHLPHFVYSKPLKLTVTQHHKDTPAASVVKKGIALLNVKEGARYKPPLRIQFHASGLNVAHQAQREKDTGFFRLTLVPAKGSPVEMPFPGGQTEVWLAPPAGAYTLKLDLIDALNPGKTLAETASAAIKVD